MGQDQDQDVRRRFAAHLRALRQSAGQPSLSALERLSGHQLKRATVSDQLSDKDDKRVNLPEWRFVREFVLACHAAAAENGIAAAGLGTEADWNRHWASACEGNLGTRLPGRNQPAAAGPDPAEGDSAPSPGGQGEGRPAAGEAAGSAQARPSVWGPVPPRLPDFVGRHAWLTTVHHALAVQRPRTVVVIQGLFGVGKTQLAAEYAHRHAHEYDLVWWIPCGDAESARGALSGLAAKLEVPELPEASDENRYADLFDVLRRGQRYPRWLLIYDNANEPEQVKGLIPPLSGHVLVTTRNSRWEAWGSLIELGVWEKAESLEFLRRRMRRFSPVAAHRLAEGTGDLPLVLEHAVESHLGVDAYLARLATDPLALLDAQPTDYRATIAGEWRELLRQLRHLAPDAPDALDLLCCLAFFGGGQVPGEFLERGSPGEEVSLHALLRDPLRRVRAIRNLRRTGLLQVDSGTGAFAIHQVTRCVVRDVVARSGAEEQERARHDVHLLLAAADPLAPDDPAKWRGYEELSRHATESGLLDCPHELVRKSVVNLVRFLNAAGDPRAGLDTADEALVRWGDGGQAPASYLTLLMAKADALFALGRHDDAAGLRQEVLTALRAAPDGWAAEIIRLDGTYGAFLRMAGRLAEGEAADRESRRTHIAEFGDDDPRTFEAVHGHIAALALSGAAAEAADAADGLYRGSLTFYGYERHPSVLAAQSVCGQCLWLSGKYAEAARLLAQVQASYEALAGSGAFDEDHPWRLSHEVAYAAARRDAGLTTAGLLALADETHHVRRRCWRVLGDRHPQTLAASVVEAGIVRRIGDRAGEAERLLEDAGMRYESALPGHPYAHSCAGFLAAVRSQGAPAGSAQAGRSALVLSDVVMRLSGSVGEAHPLSLTAESALANALARAGEPDAALARGQRALAGLAARFGAGHPHALACEANIATVQARLGGEPPPRGLRARYVAALGVDHPDVAAFGRGELIDIDFTPLPL